MADPPEAFDAATPLPDPVERFRRWWEDARTAMGAEADVMVVATAGEDGRPSARSVVLRGFGPDGFAFSTNLWSGKARDLAARPHAALVFYWPAVVRQVRIEGRAERTTHEEDEASWRSRPANQRLAEWVAAQSDPVVDREELTRAHDEALRRFGDDVPLPERWGGYRVIPDRFEFWQGREHGLHDRIEYVRAGDEWTARRLAP